MDANDFKKEAYSYLIYLIYWLSQPSEYLIGIERHQLTTIDILSHIFAFIHRILICQTFGIFREVSSWKCRKGLPWPKRSPCAIIWKRTRKKALFETKKNCEKVGSSTEKQKLTKNELWEPWKHWKKRDVESYPKESKSEAWWQEQVPSNSSQQLSAREAALFSVQDIEKKLKPFQRRPSSSSWPTSSSSSSPPAASQPGAICSCWRLLLSPSLQLSGALPILLLPLINHNNIDVAGGNSKLFKPRLPNDARGARKSSENPQPCSKWPSIRFKSIT